MSSVKRCSQSSLQPRCAGRATAEQEALLTQAQQNWRRVETLAGVTGFCRHTVQLIDIRYGDMCLIMWLRGTQLKHVGEHMFNVLCYFSGPDDHQPPALPPLALSEGKPFHPVSKVKMNRALGWNVM